MELANDLSLMWPDFMVRFSHFVGLLLAMPRCLPSQMPAIFNCSRVVTSVDCCAVCSKSKCTAGPNNQKAEQSFDWSLLKLETVP